MYIRKTVDVWEIYVYYSSQGWEYECTELSAGDAKRTIKYYRDNTPYPIKSKKKRVKK